MHISKHNFKELESLIYTLDENIFSEMSLLELDQEKLKNNFDYFLSLTCSNFDLIKGIVDELKILSNCIQEDARYHL